MAFTNIRKVRIEWGDCDPAGIIFYPRYFGIFDNATAGLFEAALGMTKLKYLDAYEFAGFPLVDTRSTFHKPTRFGDDVEVKSTIEFGTSSFTVHHRLTLAGELCAECTEKRVWVGRDAGQLRAQPIPDAVKAKFS
ncbi:MAG: acyl-CoA thioesterase [Pseudolabrys sp.]|nr:acyl-CoA thioesterase [Pseudolabrys sp.]MBV9260259.1 acyl-CoA thioesterase [Pseudolabrys sp.]